MRVIKEEMNSGLVKGGGAILTGYIPEECLVLEEKRKFPGILIIPGGGYSGVSPTEKEPVALEFLRAGIRTFTLEYHVAPHRFPVALCEALLAVEYIRKHGSEFDLDSTNLGICGFSAGGHLAACTAAFWNRDFIKNEIGESRTQTWVDKVILCYPVISGGEYAHEGSFQSLLGENDSPEIRELLSIEKQVTEAFPPTFLWHTADDRVVPVQNSLKLAEALSSRKVPIEMHIYSRGRHGLSLGNHLINSERSYGEVHESGEWIQKAIDFMYR